MAIFEPWRLKAACLNSDPEMFFPSSDQLTLRRRGSVEDQVAAAQEVCDTCPVIKECRDGATARGEKIGVWGGVWFERNAPQPAHWYQAAQPLKCTDCGATIAPGEVMKSDGEHNWCRPCALLKD